MYCDDKAGLVEERIDRILTQYRESPNLLGIIRHDLGQIADIIIEANGSRGFVSELLSAGDNVLSDEQQVIISDPDCQPVPGMPEKFDIMTAVGDQLTIIGKWLGFPRCHCICQDIPVFGFSCDEFTDFILSDSSYVLSDGDNLIITDNRGKPLKNIDIVGLCESGSWFGCGEGGTADICFNDDNVYRRYLLARRYQSRQLWDIDSLQAAAEYIWGNTATTMNMGGGRVGIVPGRRLSLTELIQVPVAMRVLPIAPGITPYISYNTGVIFGFGDGWGGLCENSQWFCPQEFDAYNCN